MYLYIDEYGEVSQHAGEPSNDDCEQVDAGNLTIIRFQDGKFEQATVKVAFVLEDEDDEDSAEIEEYSLDGWAPV